MNRKDILLLLGGAWHDFEGFAAAMKLLLEGEGFSIYITYDPDTLTRIDNLKYDLVLSYTCFQSAPGKESVPPVRITNDQAESLVRWVNGGGAWLAMHAASVLGDSDDTLEKLLGGAFIEHPPQCTFTVLPVSLQHPITDGLNAFEVVDELYIERYHPSVTIHMIVIHEQVAYPLVWSRTEGLGRVAHIALGHSQHTWEQIPFQHLVLQTIGWLMNQ
jgi:hypothetical protein